MKVQKSVITPGNPSGNSPAENLVHRVKLVLKNLAHNFPRQWRKFLPIVQYALKMTHDDEVGVPPFYAHTGKMPKPMSEMEVVIKDEDGKEEDAEPSQELGESETKENRQERSRRLAAQMMEVLTNATKVILEERHARMKKVKGKEMAPTDELKVNEIVWLIDERVKTKRQDEKKLLNPRTGPFRVLKVARDGQTAVLSLGPGKERRYNVKLMQRYVAPLVGIYPTEGRGCIQGVPVEVIAHRERDGADQYLIRYLTEEGEVQEWNAWELAPPILVRDFLHNLENNVWISRCHTGKQVDVWWPLEHRQFPGVITSVMGNLLRIEYLDGDRGEAIIQDDGTIVQAEEFDESQEAGGRRQAPRDETQPGKPKKKAGRPKGSKNKVPFRARRGRGLIAEAEAEARKDGVSNSG